MTRTFVFTYGATNDAERSIRSIDAMRINEGSALALTHGLSLLYDCATLTQHDANANILDKKTFRDGTWVVD